MKKSMIMILGGISAFLFIFNSCRKDPLNHLTQEESRIYITNKDSSANFSAFNTFSIVDSVAVIENGGQKKELKEGDAKLLQLITDQMKSRGYILVNKDQDPDLGINVTRITQSYLNVVQNPYRWWDYPGYWNTGFWGYPGYGYYFPGSFGYYPPLYQFYRSRQDLITIDLIDLKHAKKDEQLEGIWNATLKGSGVLNAGNYEQEIQAVFEQSPYLQSKE